MNQFPYQIKASGKNLQHIISLSTHTHSLEHALQIANQYVTEGWAQIVLISDRRTGKVCWREEAEECILEEAEELL